MKVLVTSSVLTIIQYGLAVVLLYLSSFFADHPVLVVIQIAGILLGIWAIIEMRKSKLNPAPVPRSGSSLITSGPYNWVRHPMYLALLLFFYPVALPGAEPVTYFILFVFTINLILKLLYEEKLLAEKFGRYNLYRQKTWRLIPGVF